MTHALQIIQMLVINLNYQKLVETLFFKHVVNKKSVVVVAEEIADKQNEYAIGRAFNNYRYREGLKFISCYSKTGKI